MFRRVLFFLAILVIALPLLAVPQTKTLANLQAAFNGESNAHAKYLLFAEKADAEGYGKAASLFRAAAKAEEIHASNHAKVIKALGAVPTAKIEKPDVRTTAENVAAAVKGETYERDVMYPDFLKAARAENQMAAVRTFNLAKAAEAEHAKLYTDAGKNLASMKGTAKYYVCEVCGFTTAKLDFAKCPKCANPKEKFVAVS